MLSENLSRRRRDLALTQEQVALAADMNVSYYHRVERGKIDPGTRMLTRVARALRTTPAALLEGVE